MTAKVKPKWHYFNETDPICIRKGREDIQLQTACQRHLDQTGCMTKELKSLVTCVKCLKTLNKLEGE